MCGIAGVYFFTPRTTPFNLEKTLKSLVHRGPDNTASVSFPTCQLAHTRLAILDTSSDANQPMVDETGRYHLIFNGEIYNYRSIRATLQNKGITFTTSGDTEVVLKQLIVEGISGVSAFNGFFSLAFFDKETNELLLVRDRFGIKPLLYSCQEDHIIFSSELTALENFSEDHEMDQDSLHQYLHLSYIPGPNSIYKQVKKLLPGHYMRIKNGSIKTINYYRQNEPLKTKDIPDYSSATQSLKKLLEESVRDRLISDVPLGTFLSGGLDSSIIATIAARHKKDLESFSLGFKKSNYFDETAFAETVAKKAGTKHHTILLEEDELLDNLDDFLVAIDEPFADSSALAYFVLSKYTSKHVKVALSGDGADELFAGYNKYSALEKSMASGMKNTVLKNIHPLTEFAPKSRSSNLGNFGRKLNKYTKGLSLNDYDRYWAWSGFTNEEVVSKLLVRSADQNELNNRKHLYLPRDKELDLQKMLRSDQHLVMTNDMLFKADKMSMANSLEVRVPFLDHRVVEYCRQLPVEYKLQRDTTKRILRDAFKNDLPIETLNRSKKGFEVPLEDWFNGPLKNRFLRHTESDFIVSQGIFNHEEIKRLRKKLNNKNIANDVHLMWAIFIFQNFWHRKYTQ